MGDDPALLTSFSASLSALAHFDPHPTLAIAVSGGADSMALLLLANDWAKARDGKIVALTVDHGLRSESKTEAKQVSAWCKALGIEHHILDASSLLATRQSPLATQAEARTARYRLLADWCHAHSVLHLLTAHHRDDQMETLFFRLARGSRLDGLACMQPVTTLAHGVRLLRPLLSIPKSDLIALLKSAGQPWLEDPSNQHPRYTRNRIRTALALCNNLESISQRAYEVTKSLATFRVGLENNLAQKLERHVRFSPNEDVTIDATGFMQLEPEYGLRLLAHIVQRLGGHEHKPRTEKLERLYGAIAGGNHLHPQSLGGCVFYPPLNGQMRVSRELRKTA